MQVELAPRTGLRLRNPVVISSGTLGYGDDLSRRFDVRALGAFISKGTTLHPRTGNAPLRLVETSGGMLNAIGLHNIGVDAVLREKAPIWASWKVPVFVNVSGSTVEEYVEVVERLDGVHGVAGIELNVSCPNVHAGGVAFGIDANLVSEVTAAVRSVTTLPLIVKLSPNVTDIRCVARAAQDAGADAISLINTVYGMAIDTTRRRPALENVSGGLSGPAVKPYALYLVYQVAQEVSIPIVGYGGIMSARDALEFVMAGATAVGLATALLVNPVSWQRVALDIRAWCSNEGITHLTEIIGCANPGFLGVDNKRVPAVTGSGGHSL